MEFFSDIFARKISGFGVTKYKHDCNNFARWYLGFSLRIRNPRGRAKVSSFVFDTQSTVLSNHRARYENVQKKISYKGRGNLRTEKSGWDATYCEMIFFDARHPERVFFFPERFLNEK